MVQVTTEIYSELDTYTVDSTQLVFIEDAEFEFVGGGNAVNSY